MSNLCTICGEFMDITEFEISDEICKWCDVTIRDKVVNYEQV